MDMSDTWRAFAHGDAAARERLLTQHLGLVHFVARQVARGISVDADFDELVSAGAIGLVNALEAFDASRGLAFSTFAAPRIRGAILDELRRQDHVPRSIRKKSRDIGAAREALTRTLGYTPSDKVLAEHLEVDMDTLWRWQADVEGIFHLPIDVSSSPSEKSAPTPGELLTGDQDGTIEDELNFEEEVGVLRD